MHSLMIKVGIVDDHAMVRSGLRQYLADQSDLQVVGEAGTAGEAIDLAQAIAMDVMVLDLSMPGQNGMDAMPLLRAKAPAMGILVLSGYPAEQYAPHAISMGADAYLSKDCPPTDIVQAIRAVASQLQSK
jgi:two-component system, NarL family, invasion response regulator UvrY